MSHRGFRCLDPSTQCIYITRHTRFDELSFPFTNTSSSCDPISLISSSFNEPAVTAISTANQKTSPSLPIAPSISSCVPRTTDLVNDFVQHLSFEPTATSVSLDETIASPAVIKATSVVSLPSDQFALLFGAFNNLHSMITRAKAGVFKPKHHSYVTPCCLHHWSTPCLLNKNHKVFHLPLNTQVWVATVAGGRDVVWEMRRFVVPPV